MEPNHERFRGERVVWTTRFVVAHARTMVESSSIRHGSRIEALTRSARPAPAQRFSAPTHRVKPIQKLKTCLLSCWPETTGNPKSNAIGTGPNIGTVNRRPKPTETR